MSRITAYREREKERRKTIAAAVASIILHALIILGIAFFLYWHPALIPLPEEEEDTPLEITIVDPEPPKPVEPMYVATTSTQKVETPPENAPFESDNDTRAASPLPATGDAPVPSTEGEESPTLELENRDYTPGKLDSPAAPPVAPSQPSQPVPPQPQQEPQPTPTPEPPKPEEKPQPTPEATATPKPVEALALLEPPTPRAVETPRPTPPQEQQPQEKPPEQPRPPSPPQPSVLPGYQPQTRVTRLRGSVSNRGRASVDAVATPLGRYKKMLSDAIGSRWYYYVNEQLTLLHTGTVDLRFIVRRSGKVEKVEVIRNSSNESFASISVRAVMDAEIPPIPEDIVPMLDNGRIEIEYSFTILPN